MHRPVPVNMGSPSFTVAGSSACLVTSAWFPPGAVLEPHVHDRPTFAVILAGGFDLAFTSPGVRRYLECTPGTLFTEPAGEQHANYIGSSGARVVVLQPDLTAGSLPEGADRLLDRINHFRDGPLESVARQIAREVTLGDDLSTLALDGLAVEALDIAVRRGQSTRHHEPPPPWLRTATDLIHDQFRDRLRLAEIASAAGVHVAHLAEVFRRVHRMPPAAYVRRLRIEWAAERLVSTRLPISVVAAEAGFADQAHLTRWFRRVVGMSPAAWRRRRALSRNLGGTPYRADA